MQLEAIIVLEDGKAEDVTRILLQSGYSAVFVDDLEKAMIRLSHNGYRAAVMTGAANADPVEFAVRTQDRNSDIPVVVVAEAADEPERRALEKMDNVYLIHNPARDLIPMLEEIIGGLGRES
mgnify:CR=1 FL=1